MKPLYKVFLVLALVASALSYSNGTVAEAQDAKTRADISDVRVEKVSANVFRVIAKGTVTTGGWIVNLIPAVYVMAPENWDIETSAIPPTGFVTQVITPWTASVEMNLSRVTRRVSVKGSNQTITKAVPWD